MAKKKTIESTEKKNGSSKKAASERGAEQNNSRTGVSSGEEVQNTENEFVTGNNGEMNVAERKLILTRRKINREIFEKCVEKHLYTNTAEWDDQGGNDSD